MRLPATIDADICIVGAGAAGITLATQLLPTGLDICLIESGDFAPDADTQALYDLESTGYPPRPDYMSRARYFGGSCNLWAGRSMRLTAARLRTARLGAAQRLADSLRRGRRVLSGGGAAFSACRTSGYVRRQSRTAHVGDRAPDLLEASSWSPTISVWATQAHAIRRRHAGPACAPRQNLRVLLKPASATNLAAADRPMPSNRSRRARSTAGVSPSARAATCWPAAGSRMRGCCSSSRDRQPDGIGNRYDLVGRYFMDHPRAVFGRCTSRPARSAAACGAGRSGTASCSSASALRRKGRGANACSITTSRSRSRPPDTRRRVTSRSSRP